MRSAYFHVSSTVSSYGTYAQARVYITVFAMGTQVDMITECVNMYPQGDDRNIL
jgi:hypothetical protein